MNSGASLLLQAGLVGPDQIAQAEELCHDLGGSFGECLIHIGAIDEESLVEFYHKRLLLPRLEPTALQTIPPRVLALVAPDMAAEFRVIPVEADTVGGLTLAMADPADNHAVDEVAFFTDRFVLRAVAGESAVRRAIEQHYPVRLGPRRSQVDEPVLLTQVKQSPPVVLNDPPRASAPVEEPILLTHRARLDRITLPGVAPTSRPPSKAPATVALPDPPLGALREAATRDAIVELVLGYVGRLAERVLFFVVRKSLLVGYQGVGPGLERQLVKELQVSLEAPSIFREVVASRLPFRGPLPETALHRAFAKSIGGVDGEVAAMPIAVRGRVIALLYADRARHPLPDAALHAALAEAGLAYERLLMAK